MIRSPIIQTDNNNNRTSMLAKQRSINPNAPSHTLTLTQEQSCSEFNLANCTTCYEEQATNSHTCICVCPAAKRNKEGLLVDRQFWKKLRMMKKCQYCRFCNAGTDVVIGGMWGLLRKYAQNWGGLVDTRFKFEINKMVEDRRFVTSEINTHQSNDASEIDKLRSDRNQSSISSQTSSIIVKHLPQLQLQFYTSVQSQKQITRLLDYYQYYQYMPLMPTLNENPAKSPVIFKIVDSYLHKKIQLIYAEIKARLKEKEKSNEDSLENLQDVTNQDIQLEGSLVKYNKQDSLIDKEDEDSVEQGLLGVSKSVDSVCNILDQLNFNENPATSSLRKCREKQQKNSNQRLTKNNNEKGHLQFEVVQKMNQSKQFMTNKSQSAKNKRTLMNNDHFSKRTGANVEVSLKKVKKNKFHSSCGNLNRINATAKQEPPRKNTKDDQNKSLKNNKKSQFESARVSLSNKKKNMNTISNLKDYIINLKKKINADKQHLRNTHSHYEPKQSKLQEISCFHSANSKLSSVQKRKAILKSRCTQEVEDFHTKIQSDIKGSKKQKAPVGTEHKKSTKLSNYKLEQTDKKKKPQERKMRLPTESQKKIKKVKESGTETKKLKNHDHQNEEKRKQETLSKKLPQKWKLQTEQIRIKQKPGMNRKMATTNKKKKNSHNTHSSIITQF